MARNLRLPGQSMAEARGAVAAQSAVVAVLIAELCATDLDRANRIAETLDGLIENPELLFGEAAPKSEIQAAKTELEGFRSTVRAAIARASGR